MALLRGLQAVEGGATLQGFACFQATSEEQAGLSLRDSPERQMNRGPLWPLQLPLSESSTISGLARLFLPLQ